MNFYVIKLSAVFVQSIWNPSQLFSTGLKSAQYTGQFILVILFPKSHDTVCWLVCMSALLCWKLRGFFCETNHRQKANTIIKHYYATQSFVDHSWWPNNIVYLRKLHSIQLSSRFCIIAPKILVYAYWCKDSKKQLHVDHHNKIFCQS